jgi:hypothetical protein
MKESRKNLNSPNGIFFREQNFDNEKEKKIHPLPPLPYPYIA